MRQTPILAAVLITSALPAHADDCRARFIDNRRRIWPRSCLALAASSPRRRAWRLRTNITPPHGTTVCTSRSSRQVCRGPSPTRAPCTIPPTRARHGRRRIPSKLKSSVRNIFRRSRSNLTARPILSVARTRSTVSSTTRALHNAWQILGRSQNRLRRQVDNATQV